MTPASGRADKRLWLHASTTPTPSKQGNRCPKLTHLGHRLNGVRFLLHRAGHLPWGMNLSALAGVLCVSPPN
ncbi:MAG: hypothetical protein ACUVXA_15755, partial [Candidatus Jordarchaeum sp.]|uniref:hypothetical protein n=1 Tax=Candidatus Jordarchaeum sp. TaxID=2823881 RepID=UPI00404B0ACA